jgi:hypothetical protein
MKDSNRLVCAVMDMLECGSAAGYADFREVGCTLVAVPRVEQMAAPQLYRHHSAKTMGAPADTFRATQKTLKAIAARFSPCALKARHENHESRRATLPTITSNMSVHTNPSSTSLSSSRSQPPVARSEPTLSPHSHRASLSMPNKRYTSQSAIQNRNIDYLSFANDSLASYALAAHAGVKTEVSSSDWERLLSSLDNGQTNIYDTIYGGPPADALIDMTPLSAATDSNTTWSPNAWNWGNYSDQAAPKSVLSFSDESLTSGEDFGNGPLEYDSTPGSERLYAGIMIPDMNAPTGLGGLDGNFGL